ncbi:hypothetical protein V1478_002647 [Vespula squamosa]|uniref:Uncharacterized protein n=1 Tax=Vespula squamosa TaxID=30214 RepID=A0ABD2BUL5_VESSQ
MKKNRRGYLQSLCNNEMTTARDSIFLLSVAGKTLDRLEKLQVGTTLSTLDSAARLACRQADRPGWLVGWLAGWLAVWLVGWLAGWLAGWLVGWLVGGWLVSSLETLIISGTREISAGTENLWNASWRDEIMMDINLVSRRLTRL